MPPSPTPTQQPPKRPVVARRYELLREIGRGGMGTVHEARCLATEHRVAVKRIPLGDASDAGSRRKRFEREARILAALRHPNTVRLLDHGIGADGVAYLVMEYVRGETLSRVIRHHGPLQERLALAVVLEVCASLREAHACGIVHRDVKPANIVVRDDANGDARIKLLDFGIGKELVNAEDDGATHPGSFVGSHRHASPEQLLGAPADPRSDVYSVGILLFEMLTGTVPFSRPPIKEYAARKSSRDRLRLRSRFPFLRISARTESTIRTCLEGNPRYRYQSATELSLALRCCLAELEEQSVGSVPDSNPILLLPTRRISREPDPRPHSGQAALGVRESLGTEEASGAERSRTHVRVLTSKPLSLGLLTGIGAGLCGTFLYAAMQLIGG